MARENGATNTPEADGRIPLTLLTGFLGSGKTTLLNRLLAHPRLAKAAVIVNEFGDVALDHALVAAVSETIVLLQSGCVCCSIRGDLIETLHDLLERSLSGEIPAFDRVVIETTGLADPTPVLYTLTADQVLAASFRLDGTIVTVDAATGDPTLDRQPESVKQVAVADRIVLTKTDLVDAARADALAARLGHINPAAPVLRARGGDIAPDAILDAGTFDAAGSSGEVRVRLHTGTYAAFLRHGGEVRSTCLVLDEPVPRAVLDAWLDALRARPDPGLLRLKGLVHVEGADGPLLVHGVQHILHPPEPLGFWPGGDRRTRVVLIGRGLAPEALADRLAILRGAAPAGLPA